MRKKRVLHILNWLNYGGAERFLLNLLQHIDKERYEFDIMVRNPKNPMSSEFEKIGASIIKAPTFPQNFLQHHRYFKKFVKECGHQYDYVHVHANSLIYVLPVYMFNKYARNTKIIMHSHSSLSTNRYVTSIHHVNRKWVNKLAHKKVAVSDLAGRWMFGDEQFELIYNGIDINRYLFNSESRMSWRHQLQLSEDDILLGIVGRLVPVKNHEFVISLLSQLNRISSKKYKLVIVGDGELEHQLKQSTVDKNLQEQVIFTGPIDDIPGILSAMDIYIQPSLFEGLPFTVIEAQISNLPVLISDRISPEVMISDNLVQLDLDNKTEWADKILKITNFSTRNEYEGVEMEKFNMDNIAKVFEEDIYD